MPASRYSAALALALLVLSCGQAPEPSAPAPSAARAAYDADGATTAKLAAAGARPNVILLILDTLRADAIQPTEPETAPMPFLSRLASQHVCFTEASAPAPWTFPSITSLLTSHLPHEHGITTELTGGTSLERLPTLPEILRNSLGYATTAFFGNLGMPMAGDLARGCDEFEGRFGLSGTREVLAPWVARRDRSRPFFLMLHSFEPHDPYGAANHPFPYRPPDGYDQALAEIRAMGSNPDLAELTWLALTSRPHAEVLWQRPDMRVLSPEVTRFMWDGLSRQGDPSTRHDEQGLGLRLKQAYREGLTWMDGLMEQWHAYLKESGLLENTLLVIAGDHGEAFGEHGHLRHFNVLYDELLRVPLIVAGPPPFDRPLLVESSVGLVDVAPTILDLLGAPPLEGAAGSSLRPLLTQGGGDRVVEAQEERSRIHTGGAAHARLASLRTTSWKYICTHDLLAGTLTEEVFDLRSDPEERRNLVGGSGLAQGVPFEEEFCRAVERVRSRLWGQAARSDWAVGQGYSAGVRTTVTPRPTSDCELPPASR